MLESTALVESTARQLGADGLDCRWTLTESTARRLAVESGAGNWSQLGADGLNCRSTLAASTGLSIGGGVNWRQLAVASIVCQVLVESTHVNSSQPASTMHGTTVHERARNGACQYGVQPLSH